MLSGSLLFNKYIKILPQLKAWSCNLTLNAKVTRLLGQTIHENYILNKWQTFSKKFQRLLFVRYLFVEDTDLKKKKKNVKDLKGKQG